MVFKCAALLEKMLCFKAVSCFSLVIFILVPTSKPITFAKINFNVIGLKETKDFVALIKVCYNCFIVLYSVV